MSNKFNFKKSTPIDDNLIHQLKKQTVEDTVKFLTEKNDIFITTSNYILQEFNTNRKKITPEQLVSLANEYDKVFFNLEKSIRCINNCKCMDLAMLSMLNGVSNEFIHQAQIQVRTEMLKLKNQAFALNEASPPLANLINENLEQAQKDLNFTPNTQELEIINKNVHDQINQMTDFLKDVNVNLNNKPNSPSI